MSPKRIGLVGFDQVTALHLIGTADAFTAAVLDDGYGGRIPCYEICTIGAPARHFRTESGVSFTAETDLRHAPVCDTIIVAGGVGLRDPLLADEIADWLLRQTGETRRIGAVCTGIYALAATGLLDARAVTTHWRIAQDLARRFPSLQIDHKKAIMRDGPYWTAHGLSGGINLSLAMIEEDYGPYVTRTVARELELAPAAPNDRSIPVASPLAASVTTDRFADLVSWIVRNLQSDLSVETLARRACICPSHFSKAFKSVFGQPPTEFVETLRLNEARRRLSKRQKTLQSVALSVGFTDADAFQRAFERRFGTRPSRLLEHLAPGETKRGPKRGVSHLSPSSDLARAPVH
ncbi:MAG: helix-turn-helix domain-containing protein [Chthoniobacterales bacterium]